MITKINNDSIIQQENISLVEVTKFDSIADHWWITNGKFKLLHYINSLRLDYVLNRSNGLFGKKVLDVGCGGGILAESMAREGAEVTGLDISYESLKIAKIHALENDLVINYLQQTVEEHANTNIGIYEVLTCMEVLEHVPNPLSVVRACAKVVKSGGDIFFSTINRNYKAWLMIIFGAEYIFRMIPYGTHSINKFIKPAELLNWADSEILCEQHIIGLNYSLLRNKFFLDSNIDVNYILHLRKYM